MSELDYLRAEVERLRADIDECWVPLYHGARNDASSAEARAEAAEAKLAAVEALADRWAADAPLFLNWNERVADLRSFETDLRAALASVRRTESAPGADWSCQHHPRCADAACSHNPAMQTWIKGGFR